MLSKQENCTEDTTTFSYFEGKDIQVGFCCCCCCFNVLMFLGQLFLVP